MYAEPDEDDDSWDSEDFYSGFDPFEDRDLYSGPEDND